MNLYKYILSILFPVVLSVLTFSCKEEAGIELFQNLDIVKVDSERNILLVKGCIPGPKGSIVTIREAKKVTK